MAHLVGHGFEKRVFFPDGRLETGDVLGDAAVVSADEVETFTVFGLNDVVGGMLVAHAEFFQELEVIVVVIAGGVLASVKPGHRDHVEAVEGVEEAEGTADFSFAPVDRFIGKSFESFDGNRFVLRGKSDAEDAFIILVRNDEATFGVEGHRDPRAMFFWDVIKEFRIKALAEGNPSIGVFDKLGRVLGEAHQASAKKKE